MERLLIEVRSTIYQLPGDQLKKVLLKAKIPHDKDVLKKELRSGAIAAIEKYLAIVISEDDGKEALEALKLCVDEVSVVPEKKQSEDVTDTLRSVFRKDFKIFGSICEKGGLTYCSVIRQIDSAVKSGHRESEIVEGVIKAVSPSLKLRSFLEGKPDLTFLSIKRILRAYFQEKSSTELYTELNQAAQQPKESPTEFLMRVLDLKQRVLFASEEEDTGIKYDKTIVEALMLRTFSTGLADESVRQQMKSSLEKDPSDEQLIEELNVIVCRHNEAAKKRAGMKVKVTVNEVTEAKPKEDPIQKVLKELSSLRTEVATLKQQMSAPPGSTSDFAPRPARMKVNFGCRECKAQGRGADCNHCFRCGSNDHRIAGCPDRPENGRGPLKRDGQ